MERIRQEEGRASDGSLFVVQVDRGHTGRFRSGGYFLAMGRLSGTTSWDGMGEETRAQLHGDGSPGQGAYFQARALFTQDGPAWIPGKQRGVGSACCVWLACWERQIWPEALRIDDAELPGRVTAVQYSS